MLFCLAGLALLIAAVVLCAITNNTKLCISCLIVGEIIAFFGYAPILLKTL